MTVKNMRVIFVTTIHIFPHTRKNVNKIFNTCIKRFNIDTVHNRVPVIDPFNLTGRLRSFNKKVEC